MKRRELLAGFGAALTGVSLGGCLAGSGGDGSGGPEATTGETTAETTTGEGTGTETTDADGGTTTGDGTTTDGEPSRVTDRSFHVVEAECGKPENSASVEFRDGEAAVSVTGTIPGSSGCHTAELADASYDPGSGTLGVTVASVKREGADVCTQCVTEIDYEAAFAFEGDLPATVAVVHESMGESETVATAESE